MYLEGKRLCVKTSLLFRLLTLFLFSRTTTFDPTTREVEIEKQRFWLFFSGETVSFDDIAHIDYGYRGLATGWTWAGDTTDRLESFSIALVTTDGGRIPVAKFRGEGAASTGITGVFLGDSVVDHSGTQEEDSLGLVETIQAMTGARIGQELISTKSTRVCSECRRHVPLNHNTCQYCGGKPESVKLT